MKVKEVMKKGIIISNDSTVQEAAVLMNKNKIGCLIVVSNNKIKGILTERDILQKVTAKNKLSSKMMVEDIMTSKVMTIDSESLIDDAVYLMIDKKIKKLPVVDNGTLVGMITSTDIVANSYEIGEFFLFN